MKKNKKITRSPLVSVIIPTKNSSQYLEGTLQSIRNQIYKNIEILIVDNYSNDDTLKLANKYTKNIYQKGPERATQVNFGIQQAKGEFVYYTGSDLTMDPDLISEAVTAIQTTHAHAVYLNVLTHIKNPNMWQRARALERLCYFKEPGMSAARFWERSVFLKLGGFDESLGAMADDLEFQSRLDQAGYKTVFIDAKENNPGEYASLITIIKRSLYYGWLARKLILKHPKKLNSQYKFIRNEFIRHIDILLENKLDFLYFLLYKIIQYIFAGIGYVSAILFDYNKRIESALHKLNYG